MSESEEFEWNEFTDLGIEFLNNQNQAKQRTGISRFYYGAFCSSRDLINRKQTYLGYDSRKIMTSKSVDAHRETSKIFKHHSAYKKNQNGKIISKNLNKLRKMRNKADYDKIIIQPLNEMIIDSKKLSDQILEILKEFN